MRTVIDVEIQSKHDEIFFILVLLYYYFFYFK